MATLRKTRQPKQMKSNSALRGYNYSKLYGYQIKNNSAIDTINKYNELMNSGGWMSADDLSKYKAAVDIYSSTGNALREASKFYGTSYTDDEEKSWLDSISSLNSGYNSISNFYNQFADEKSYGNWYKYESPINDTDYDKYALAGQNIVNPDWNSAHPFEIFGIKPFGEGESINNMVTFAANNGDNIAKSIGAMNGGTTSPYANTLMLINAFMTEEEKKRYNYYVGKGDTQSAQEYLDYLMDYLTERQGGKISALSNNNASELMISALSGVQSGIQGYSNFIKGIIGNDDLAKTSALQYAQYANAEDNKGAWKAINDTVSSIGNMAPSIAAGTLGTLLAGPGVGQAVGAIGTGISSAGNSYAEMIRENYGANQAKKYGLVVGAAEAGLSYLLSGIGSLGGKLTGVAVDKIVDGIDNGIARFFAENGVNLVSEALEEGLQAILEPRIKQWATGEQTNIDWAEVGYSAMLGALSAGLIETVPSAMSTGIASHQTYTSAGGATLGGTINAAINPDVKFSDYVSKGAQNVTNVAGQHANKLATLDPGNKAAQYVQNRINEGKYVSGYQINRLAAEIETAVAQNNRGAVKSAIEKRLNELGEDNAGKVADVLTKLRLGEKLTVTEQVTLNTSKNAYLVLTESDPDNVASGNLANSWANAVTDIVSGKTENKNVIAGRPDEEEKESKKSTNSEDILKQTNKISKIAEAKLDSSKINQEALESMVKGYDGKVSADGYAELYQAAYDAGASGKAQSVLSSLINLGLSQQTAFAAYEIGKNSVLQSDTEGGIINTENAEAKNESGEGVHLRGSVQRSDGKNTEGQVSRVESDSGKTEGGRDSSRSRADEEAARLVHEGREVTVADLGIPGGSKDQKIYRLEGVEETAEMKKARKAAEKRGLVVRFFAGDNLMIETKEGRIENVRGYIQGKYVYVRADHPMYTADQIMRHELGHDMIAKGEVAVSKVVERLKKLVGEENVKAVAEFYAKAYAGTGLTVDEVWEEVICDSLGDMNIFSGDEAISKFIAPMLKDIKKATYDTKSKANQTRGSPEGKASRDHYWYPDLSQREWDLLNNRLNRELASPDNYIDKATKWLYADSRGIKVFAIYGIGDGTEATVLYAVGGNNADNLNQRRIEYEANLNKPGRNAYKKSLERIGVEQNKHDNSSNRNGQDDSRANKGTGQVSSGTRGGNNGETVSENGSRIKASRELDSLGNELTKEQQEFFKDSKVRDENGNLLVVYHGSPRGRTTVFDRNKTSKINDMGQGHYFSSNADDASTYMGEAKGRKLYEVYLNITAPFVVSDDVKISLEEAKELLKLSEDKYTANDVFYYLTREAKDGYVTTSRLANTNISQEMTDILIKSGRYDGIIDETVAEKWGLEKGTKHYIALEPNQIKKVSNKAPTDNPDIRYSRELDLIDYINEKGEGEVTAEDKPLTNREILAGALESAVTSEKELEKLQEYKKNIKELNKKTYVLSKMKEDIKRLSFGKGKKDVAKIAELKEKAAKIERSINYYDRQLTNLEAMKPIQDLLQREKQKAYQRAAEKGREALKRNVEGRHKSEARAKIKGLKEKFMSMLEHPTERQYVPSDLVSAMVKVCEMIDTSTSLLKSDGSINKAQQARNEQMQRLINLAAEYKKIKNDPDKMVAGEYEEEIAEYLDEIVANYAKKNISDMTLDELNELYRTMKAIEETLRDARKLIGWTEAESVYDAGDSIIAEQRGIAATRKQNLVSKADDIVVNMSLAPMRAVLRMAGYNEDSALYRAFREIEKGVREQKKFVMDAVKKFEALTTGKNADVYEKAIYDPYGKELVDKNGKKFYVTKMQMMQAVMSYEREMANDKLHHVSNGGFTFADIDLLGKGEIREAVSAKNAHTVTLGAELALKFQMELANDQWAQDYMAEARKFFDETAKDAINEANMKLKHRIIATGKNYIPYEVNSDYIVREITSENDIQQVISGYGMLKDLKAGATQPIIITGLNNVLDRHIEQVGNVAALAVPIRNFNKIWNVTATDRSTTVKEAISNNWGTRGTDLITQAVKDVQGSRKQSAYKWVKQLKSNLIGATFTANVSVVLKQIGSMFSATSMLNWRDPVSMIGNLFATKANRDAIAAEVNKYTAVAWVRGQGLSDAELYELKTAKKKSKISRAVDKLPNAVKATSWITQMDYDVALSLWKYAKEDVAKRTGLEGEELLQATAEYYNDVIENTQSMSDALHRPEIQKKDDIVSETFGIFKTDLYQNAGLLRVALENVKANPGKESNKALVKALGGTFMSMCWGSLITSLMAALRYKVDRYRDDEDDEITVESWSKAVATDMAEEMVGYLIPLFGSEAAEIVSAVVNGESYEFDNLMLSAINDLVKAMTSVGATFKEEDFFSEKAGRAWKNLLIKAAAVFGVPANNVVRFIEAVKKHAQDIANGEFLSFEAGLTSKNPTRLYNAYLEGDLDKIEKASILYEDEKTVNEALRQQLREKDTRMQQIAQCELLGDTKRRDALKKEIVAEGHFDKDEVVGKAIDSEINYVKNKIKEAKAYADKGKTAEAQAIYKALIKRGYTQAFIDAYLKKIN